MSDKSLTDLLNELRGELDALNVKSEARRDQVVLKIDHLKEIMEYYVKELSELKAEFNKYKSQVMRTIITVSGFVVGALVAIFSLVKQ